MSRFVSGGTVDQPEERDDAWRQAQEEVEARHKQKQEDGKQEGGKSLYETLQANKTAKEDAFQESIRLKNQFRALTDEEVDYLDNYKNTVRSKEAAIKKETAEQLNQFRQQQEQAAKADTEAPIEVSEDWSASNKKRKRANKDLPGLKVRRASSTKDTPTDQQPKSVNEATKNGHQKDTESLVKQKPPESQPATKSSPPPATTFPQGGLGLGAYSSDED